MLSPKAKFPDLGEFRFVESLLSKSAPMEDCPPRYRGWLPAGDDAAIFDGWLATKDLSVENVHFRMDWASPEQAVEKHIVSNVSDISAMGGVPRMALLGVCLNRNWDAALCSRVSAALAEGFAKRGIALIGGDTVAGDSTVFSTTLLGTQAGEAPLLRSAARPGDGIYVAGSLGKSAAGLWLLMNHPEEASRFARLVEYHLCPKIHESAGAELARLGGCGACMDISDGLSSELNHLALSSGVSMEIDLEKLPIDPQVLEMADYFKISALDLALNGGEEYHLLFSFADTKSILLKNNERLGAVSRIGTVRDGSGVYCLGPEGKRNLLKAQAWSHI